VLLTGGAVKAQRHTSMFVGKNVRGQGPLV